MSRAGLDKDPRDVAEMFDGVAKGYDRTNSVMTLGFDRRWRWLTRRVLDATPRERILDLAAGTAVSTAEYARSGAWCVAADFSLGMLRSGVHRDVPKVAADAFHLPFTDGAFDAVTVSFGLRNMNDTVAALREMCRVVRPGGRLVVCEVSQPPWRPIRWLHYNVVLRLLPRITRPFSSNREAYTYLAESMRDWHDQRTLAELIAEAGWRDVEWLNLTLGVVALHRATKPVAESRAKPVAESVTEPVAESATEPPTESRTEPVTEPVTESVTEAGTEPRAGTAAESVTQPVTEPRAESAAEPSPGPGPSPRPGPPPDHAA